MPEVPYADRYVLVHLILEVGLALSRVLPIAALAVAVTVSSASAATAAVVAETPERTTSVNGTVYSVVYAGDTVYIGGHFSTARDSSGTVTRNNAAAINASTGQLLRWNPNVNGTVRAIATVPGGVALGGAFGTVRGERHPRLAVVTPITGAPTSFSGSANRTVRSLASNARGRLFVGGQFTSVNGRARSGLAAFNGNTLTSWAPRAVGGTVRTLHRANGWVLAGGTFNSINGTSGSGFLAALSPSSGAVITSWNPPLSVPVNDIDAGLTTVYAAADGRGGRLGAYRLSNGDQRWAVRADGGVQAVSLWGSAAFFGGHFDHVGTASRRKLARVDTTAGALQAWNPRANSAAGVLALDHNRTRLGVGGAFTTFNGGATSQPHFAQFH
jgi:hypothetical protein